MPNEAYLYTTDDPTAWDAQDLGCHASCWCIPIGWFFLFTPADLCLADVTSWYDGSVWKEIRFRANKDSALRVFADRRPVFEAFVAGRIGEADLDAFLEDLRAQTGHYLIMNPSSVFCEEEDAPYFYDILGLIEKRDVGKLTRLDVDGSVVGGFRRAARVGPLLDVLGYRASPW